MRSGGVVLGVPRGLFLVAVHFSCLSLALMPPGLGRRQVRGWGIWTLTSLADKLLHRLSSPNQLLVILQLLSLAAGLCLLPLWSLEHSDAFGG